ncbi:amidohydrolase family protein [Streptomyces anulatus]|uniref:amidohydrolase family protein n=1 Tax=Streptomyces anulatus TaxID=1892 RepID=UPI0036A87D40
MTGSHAGGVEDASVMELNGEPMTQEKIDELQKNAPGTVVNMHFLHPDDKPEDAELLDLSVLFPGAAIASDAMPWVNKDGTLVEGDVWPMPTEAFAHPRSAGCFSRFLSRWARGADGEKPKVSLIEAIRRTSLIPAQILEKSVPQMRGKDRLQVGADADIVVFDLATVQDNATFTEPAQHSTGFQHVLVNGTPIIRDGKELLEQRPGKPIRRPRATTLPGVPGTGAAEPVEAS